MTTALICAMPMELAPLVKKLGLRSEGKRKVGDGVVAIYTGMGTELATKSTEALFEAVPDIDRVVVFGITGGINDEQAIGTLIVPEIVLNSETGEEFKPHAFNGHTPKGTMWTTNVMTPAHEYPAMIERGVISLDMETAAIAKCCEERNVPWEVYRTISDNPSDNITDEVFKLSNQDGSPNPGRVLRFFLKHPNKIPAMVKLARGSRIATNSAADAAIAAWRN
jgi:nucleoside phosphorylase